MTDSADKSKGWFRNAFAVDEPGPVEPTEAQRPVVDWVCEQIARRRLAMPGLLFLELTRPLNWVAAQGMHGLSPFVWAIVNQQTHDRYQAFTEFLEHRGSIDYLCQRIEELEDEMRRRRAGDRDEPANPRDDEHED